MNTRPTRNTNSAHVRMKKKNNMFMATKTFWTLWALMAIKTNGLLRFRDVMTHGRSMALQRQQVRVERLFASFVTSYELKKSRKFARKFE